ASAGEVGGRIASGLLAHHIPRVPCFAISEPRAGARCSGFARPASIPNLSRRRSVTRVAAHRGDFADALAVPLDVAAERVDRAGLGGAAVAARGELDARDAERVGAGAAAAATAAATVARLVADRRDLADADRIPRVAAAERVGRADLGRARVAARGQL